MKLLHNFFATCRCLSLIGVCLLSACAGQIAHRDGVNLVSAGKYEEGLTKLEQATHDAPDNLEYRVNYLNAKERIVAGLVASGQRARDTGRYDDAETAYRRVLKLEPANVQSRTGLIAVEQARRHAALLDEATTLFNDNKLDAAEQKVVRVLQENPQHVEARALRRQIDDKANRNQTVSPALRKSFRKTVSLEFRDANLKQILEALSRHSGLNFVLDKDVLGNLSTTIFLRQVTVEDALDVMLSTLQLQKQVLNDTTLLIYPNTAAKQSEHQDLVVKTFYLANANAKQVLEMLKSVLKVKNAYVDESVNLLIMRDTPETIRLAERLVAAQDVNQPEVMLEVEVLEIQRSKLLNLGIQLPDQLTFAPLSASGGATLTLQDLKHLNSSTTGVTVAPLIINLQDQINDSNVLANPRIRTRNREKAEIKIGDRVPVITTTSTSTGFVSNNVQYVDVGLKLEVEPTIYPDDQVAIKLALEVSSVVKQIVAKDGTTVYQIGSRNASTLLRLKDGETQILGGLINDSDTKAANRFPGLGDLPVLGRLFSSQSDNTQKTELVLSITPRLIRSLTPSLQTPTEYWSGTETNPRLKRLASSGSAVDEPVAAKPTVAVPAVPVTKPSLDEAAESNGDDTTLKAVGTKPATNSGDDVATTPTLPPPMLRWDGASQVKVGGTVKLTLNVSSQQAIAGFPLQVKYDPTVFAAVDATPGTFMAQGNAKPEFTKQIVAGAGMVFVTQSRKSAEGAKGDGDLLTLEFRALKAAPSSMISALPAIPMGTGNQPLRQTGPAVIGVSATP